MRDRYFNRKLLNLALIILLLAGYQTVMYARGQEEKIQKLEYQLEAGEGTTVLQPENGAAYADGTYTGEGQGFGGAIEVSVKVKEGKIVSIDVTKAEGEDSAYFTSAKGVVEQIIKEQNPDVDTVSGATFSSGGIIDAVKSALEGAVEE